MQPTSNAISYMRGYCCLQNLFTEATAANPYAA
jgi:hypothetical protein